MSITVEEAEVLFELKDGKAGSTGCVLLNRPKALNALNLPMIREFHPKLGEWKNDDGVKAVVISGAGEKAFCAGGDVRAVYEAGKTGGTMTRDFFREEYLLNHRIHVFPKPYVALLDGITMGGGVGLSVHGSHRIASERLMFAMPETGIGLFPDVGGTWFLNRCPGRTGTYLALTGARLGAADAVALGIATHFVRSDRHAALAEAIYAIDWSKGEAGKLVDAVVDGFAEDPGESPLRQHFDVIDRCFAFDSVSEIFDALEAEGSEFALETRGVLAKKSPMSMKLALAQLRNGEGLAFDETMKIEFRLSQFCMRQHDFYEGIRAVLIDKDHTPKWLPETLDGVEDELIASAFEPLGTDDIVFDD